MKQKQLARAWLETDSRVDEPGPTIKICSYNVLADNYLGDGGSAFPYCPIQYLEWTYRLKLLLRDILKRDPDIVNLQEVNARHYSKFFVPLLSARGFKGCFMRKVGKDELEGVAIFYKESTMSLVSSHRLPVGELAKDPQICASFRGTPIPPAHMTPAPRAAGSRPGTPVGASTASTPVTLPSLQPSVSPAARSVPASPTITAAAVGPAAGSVGTWSESEVRGHNRLWQRLEGMPHAALAVVLTRRADGGAAARRDLDSPPAIPSAREAAPPAAPPGSSDAGDDGDDGGDPFEAGGGRGRGAGAMPQPPPASATVPPRGQQAFVITNFHAYWSPAWPELKVLQVALVTAGADRIRRQANAASGRDDAALVFCGDLNTMPSIAGPTEYDSEPGPAGWPLTPGVYELLTSGSLPQEHPHHPYTRRKDGEGGKGNPNPPLHRDSVPALKLPLRFSSAYKAVTGSEPDWTNWHCHTFIECLDYVFVGTHEHSDSAGASDAVGSALGEDVTMSSHEPAASSWQPIPRAPVPYAVLAPPAKEDILALDGGKEGGCPNEACPSDHIPLVVKFAVAS